MGEFRSQKKTPGNVLRWLFTIARNLALDHHRQARLHEAATAEPAGAKPATQEVAAAVREALARLSDLDRDVFLMRESAGLSYNEIARACSLTPDAVRSRIHRARLELRAHLSDPISHRLRSPMLRTTRDL